MHSWVPRSDNSFTIAKPKPTTSKQLVAKKVHAVPDKNKMAQKECSVAEEAGGADAFFNRGSTFPQ